MLLQRLKIPDAGGCNANVTDGEGSPAEGTAPRYSARINRASISKINTVFQTDFELFGYHHLPA